jgi:hypothetical protein
MGAESYEGKLSDAGVQTCRVGGIGVIEEAASYICDFLAYFILPTRLSCMMSPKVQHHLHISRCQLCPRLENSSPACVLFLSSFLEAS